MSHEAVAEAAVVDSPHDERGTVVKAAIVLAPGHEPSDELAEEIQDFVKAWQKASKADVGKSAR